MNQQEAILNCVICNHKFDWNNLEYCPNCNWQQIDYIGDMEHTAVLLRPEREAWVAKKNYKVSDFSYEGYIPALVEAMKNQFELKDFNESYKISPFFREWHEDDESFDARVSEKPIHSGIARWVAKKYNPKTGCFPIVIKWHDHIIDEKQEDSDDKRYFITVPKEEAKTVFDSNQFPPIYLHLHFDELKQIYAIQAYLVTNNQVFTVNPVETIELLEIKADDAYIPDYDFDDSKPKIKIDSNKLKAHDVDIPDFDDSKPKVKINSNLTHNDCLIQFVNEAKKYHALRFKITLGRQYVGVKLIPSLYENISEFDFSRHSITHLPSLDFSIFPSLSLVKFEKLPNNEGNYNILSRLKDKIKAKRLIVEGLESTLAKNLGF